MMTAKKRSAHKALSPMPLTELRMMKALLAMSATRAKTRGKGAIEEDPKTQLRMLTLKIVDKIQVLALQRPGALIIVAQVLDRLLDQELEFLQDKKHVDRSQTRTG
jgi:hypothetical protein